MEIIFNCLKLNRPSTLNHHLTKNNNIMMQVQSHNKLSYPNTVMLYELLCISDHAISRSMFTCKLIITRKSTWHKPLIWYNENTIFTVSNDHTQKCSNHEHVCYIHTYMIWYIYITKTFPPSFIGKTVWPTIIALFGDPRRINVDTPAHMT